ncbi:MFS transporter [Legionella erythra]|uniref:Transporter of the major facilitator superfamily (MFS) n=1 Tax=Legionella erythra TaxID=448 RepID=A0A0W0TKI2_LEGER|nr:MFS transporter [Legionella erythra]KTC96113.1 transporter of the major facilitator superfamily (MFS) [Legionella erythra]
MPKTAYRTFYLAYTMLFLISLSASIVPPLVGPLFLKQPGLLPGESLYARLNAYSFAVGIYGIGAILGGMLWGGISDRSGEKKTLGYCLFGSLVACLLSIISLIYVNYWLFFIGRALDGLMSGRRAVILSLLMHSDFAKHQVFRVAEMMNALGLCLGPLLCGILVNFKVQVPLYYYASPFLLILIITVINLSFVPAIAVQTLKTPLEETKTKWKDYLNALYMEFFLMQVVWGLYYIAVLPFAILEFHFSNYTIGLLFAGMVLMYLLFLAGTQKILYPRISLNRAKTMAMLFLFSGFASLGFCQGNLTVFMIANLCIVFAFAILNPAYFGAISHAHTTTHQGEAMGIVTSINGMASAITAVTLGSLLAVSLHLPFLLGTVFIAIIHFSSLIRQKRGNT